MRKKNISTMTVIAIALTLGVFGAEVLLEWATEEEPKQYKIVHAGYFDCALASMDEQHEYCGE